MKLKHLRLFLLAVLAFLASFLPSEVFAVGSDATTAVAAAFTAGTASVGAVVTGIIALGAALTGLGLIYKWLSK